MATEKELAEIRSSGLQIIEDLKPYRGRPRILCYDPDNTCPRPWILSGQGCAWYFTDEASARKYAENERLPAWRQK